MSIPKKSLISTLRTAKKANVAKDEFSLDHTSQSFGVTQPVRKLAAKASLKTTAAAKASLKTTAAAKASSKS